MIELQTNYNTQATYASINTRCKVGKIAKIKNLVQSTNLRENNRLKVGKLTQNSFLHPLFARVFLLLNLVLFLVLQLFTFTSLHRQIYALSGEENYYAQIQSKDIYLYDSPFGVPIFEIPETYYVRLLECSKNGYHKAQYMDRIGYVVDSEIQCVANPPTTPYLGNVSFRNYGTQSSELRSEPSRLAGASTLICELPLYETNFTYYGKISGEEVVPNRGDTWFYCSYTKNNQTKLGYIYSGLIDMVTVYVSNPIDAYPVIKHDWKELKVEESVNATIALPDKKQTLVILAISIPIIALLALMFKPMQAKKSPAKSGTDKQNPHSKLSKGIERKRDITLENPRYTATTLSKNSPLKMQGELNRKEKRVCAPENYFKQTRAKKGKDFYEL